MPESDPTSTLMAALWMVDEALQRASNRDAQTTGVSGGERVMLMLVDAHRGLTVGELAALLAADGAHVRRIARGLLVRDFLARAADPADRRRARLTVTQQGRAFLRFGAPGAVGRAGTRLVAALSPDLLHAVGRTAATIYNDLK